MAVTTASPLPATSASASGSPDRAAVTPAAPATPAAALTVPDPLSFDEAYAADMAASEAAMAAAATPGKGSTPATSASPDPTAADTAEGEDPETDTPATADPEPEPQGEGDGDEAANPTDDKDDDDPAAQDDDDDGAPVPKGMEDWPKPAVKRVQAQSAKIKALEARLAQGAIVITPTPLSPFADVQTVEALDQRRTQARARLQWLRANPDGGTVSGPDGTSYEITPEVAREKLAAAEAELDAYPDAKQLLMLREQHKPWEVAAAAEPELFTPGTEDNKFLNWLLQTCPEFKTRLGNWEVLAAAIVRGLRPPTADGAAPVARTKENGTAGATPAKASPAAVSAAKAGPAKAKSPPVKAPFQPSTTKPALRAAGAEPSADLDALAVAAASGDESAQRALYAAERRRAA